MQQRIKVVLTRKFDNSNKIPNVAANIQHMQNMHGAMLETAINELLHKSLSPIFDIADIKTVGLYIIRYNYGYSKIF